MLSKLIESEFSTLNWIVESEKIRYVYSREILLNTAVIREVNSTEIDSNFTARETQDYAPLQCQATNNQTNFHNFKIRNWIYLQCFLAILKLVKLAKLVSTLSYDTRAMLVLNLLAFENQKYTAYDRFHGNGPYGKIPTKKEPIRTLVFALPYNKCIYSLFSKSNSLTPDAAH